MTAEETLDDIVVSLVLSNFYSNCMQRVVRGGRLKKLISLRKTCSRFI